MKVMTDASGRGQRSSGYLLDQYNANKANNGNGAETDSMSGGYYSECNKRLKS
jgi:hypothetical protein